MAKKTTKTPPSKAKKKANTPKPSVNATVAEEVKEVKVEGVPRPKNFTSDEDVFLCRAFVSTTLDPINGSDQKADVFWTRVREVFLSLMEKEAEVQLLEERSFTSLENRYKRQIQPDALKWTAIYKNTDKESGRTDKEHFELVCEKYREKYGRPFRFLGCMEPLMELPKFDPSLRGGNDSGSVFSKMGSTKERPSGQKAAKQKQKDEKLSVAYLKSKLEVSTSTSKSMEKLADAIAKKEKREYLLSMFKVAKDIDDQEMMEDYLSKLKALEKEDSKPEAVEEDSKPEAVERDDTSSDGIFTRSSVTEEDSPSSSEPSRLEPLETPV